MKKVKLFFVLILMTCLIFPQSSFAKDTKKVGNVLSASGAVEIKKGGGNKLFKVFKNMAFTQGDTVITGSNGKAELSLDEDKEVIVAANTKLVISELISSVKAKSGKTDLTLVGGKVKVKIGKKLEGESKFNIKTPNAIMGVMGTEFYVYYDEHSTWVGVLEGMVTVDIGGDEPIKVGANQSLFIDENGNFEIVELDAEQVLRFTAESNDEPQEKPRRSIIVYDFETSVKEDYDYYVPSVPDSPDEETGDSLPPVIPPVPPIQPNPTLVSAEEYYPYPGVQTSLEIKFIPYGDTVTNVYIANNSVDLMELEEMEFSKSADTIILTEEFIQNKLELDRSSIEMQLEFSSGFILPVTLKKIALLEVDWDSLQTVLLSEYQLDKRIIIPFTRGIISNAGDIQPPSTLEARILLQDEHGAQTDISMITIEGNRLILTLSDLLPVLSSGAGYMVIIEESTLRNQENGMIQENEITVSLPELD